MRHKSGSAPDSGQCAWQVTLLTMKPPLIANLLLMTLAENKASWSLELASLHQETSPTPLFSLLIWLLPTKLVAHHAALITFFPSFHIFYCRSSNTLILLTAQRIQKANKMWKPFFLPHQSPSASFLGANASQHLAARASPPAHIRTRGHTCTCGFSEGFDHTLCLLL